MLVLESEPAARGRGARIYGEIAGYASTMDPRPGSGRGSTLKRAIELALADAGIGAGDVDVVFADAAAIPELDRTEASALRDIFGAGGVPVTAPKTMTGRLNSGAGSLDVVSALLAIRDELIPPTTNTAPAPEYDLDIVLGRPRSVPIDHALVLARGYGGFNSAVVVRK